ncbi:hypothetical protein [Streptomyces sp. NPDC001380]|uniref:hypothetical protein n=1 Tax=Streptomyces sp. NPDC001380 TaxID=3364566 RepID=UPI0036B93164
MKPWRRAAAPALCALAASALVLGATAAPAQAGSGGHRFTFAVIGDIPYGDAQIAAFPEVIGQINADPDVRFVDHLGDIKNGSTVCSDAYFQQIKADFDTFRDPLVHTVGDNEWTDCHRPNNGSYNPLERLDAIRRVFFPRPGWTLGQDAAQVDSQAARGYPENVRYRCGGVSFAAVHVVGSNNGLAPWTGSTGPTPEQSAEVLGRTAAVLENVRDTFREARKRHDRAVVLLTQADMFDPTVADPSFADSFAFQPIVKAIAEESAAFDGPVYLFNGDSHVYTSDRPLDAGSRWLSFYKVATAAPNLQRITVDGSTGVDDWLKVTVDPDGGDGRVLTWTRVPFTS